jgi:signal transduction histidine kinase
VQSVGRDCHRPHRSRGGAAEARGRRRSERAAPSRASSPWCRTRSARAERHSRHGGSFCKDTSLTAEQTTYVKATVTSGNALLSLIEEILDFSKVEAGKLELEMHPFSLVTMVEDIVELLGPRAQAKGLEIASDVDERLPERVIGDATRLRQVLLNLAGNAIKFTETGGVGIVVEAGLNSGEIVFEVRDSGIGIAPDSRLASSMNSSRPTADRHENSAAPVSAWPSRGALSSGWAAASKSRARQARARPFVPSCRCRSAEERR